MKRNFELEQAIFNSRRDAFMAELGNVSENEMMDIAAYFGSNIKLFIESWLYDVE